jgi:hypothetical protein
MEECYDFIYEEEVPNTKYVVDVYVSTTYFVYRPFHE